MGLSLPMGLIEVLNVAAKFKEFECGDLVETTRYFIKNEFGVEEIV